MSNWHWKTLDVKKPWAETWLGEQVAGVESPSLKITGLQETEGDCELGMRKSKLVTIYDLKLKFGYTQKEVSEGQEPITGTLTALEVGHDMDEDEYQFEAQTDSSGDLAMQLREEARQKLAVHLRSIFQELPKAMIREHGPTLLKESGASASAASTPAAPKTSESSSTQSGASTTSKPTAGTSGGNTLNTTTVKLSSAFKIAAKDLFELLTDASKVPMWTRNPAKIQPEAGAEVDLFGGNIQGKMISVSKPNQIVMSWRPPQWEAGHYGTLTMNLDQGSGETVLALRLDGVPIGKEDEIEKNLDTFYMRSLKQIGVVFATPDHVQPIRSLPGTADSQPKWLCPVNDEGN